MMVDSTIARSVEWTETVVRLLVQRDDVNKDNNCWTPLWLSRILGGNAVVISLLCTAG
jgi:hypothetical protein